METERESSKKEGGRGRQMKTERKGERVVGRDRQGGREEGGEGEQGPERGSEGDNIQIKTVFRHW